MVRKMSSAGRPPSTRTSSHQSCRLRMANDGSARPPRGSALPGPTPRNQAAAAHKAGELQLGSARRRCRCRCAPGSPGGSRSSALPKPPKAPAAPARTRTSEHRGCRRQDARVPRRGGPPRATIAVSRPMAEHGGARGGVTHHEEGDEQGDTVRTATPAAAQVWQEQDERPAEGQVRGRSRSVVEEVAGRLARGGRRPARRWAGEDASRHSTRADQQDEPVDRGEGGEELRRGAAGSRRSPRRPPRADRD